MSIAASGCALKKMADSRLLQLPFLASGRRIERLSNGGIGSSPGSLQKNAPLPARLKADR
jgi:hypothetical protein